MSQVKESVDTTSIDFTNAEIQSSWAIYEGTERSIKRTFGLTHAQRPIFQRFFEGDDSDIVSVSADTITIPDHYFVTGEKLKYS